jgi:hypothetical protein
MEKTIFFCIITIITIVFIKCDNDIKGIREKLPGCGISIIPPPNLKLANTGLMFYSSDQKTHIAFMISENKSILYDPTFRRAWPEKPSEIRVNNKDARLTWRTRKNHGGGYDGWLLEIIEKGKHLVVISGTEDETKETFIMLKKALLSTQWDSEIKLDHEYSFGIKLSKSNELRVSKKAFGSALVYESVRNKDVSLMIQSYEAKGINSLPCSLAIKELSKNMNCLTPPIINQITTKNLVGCESTLLTSNGLMYYALLYEKNGAIFSIVGNAPKVIQDRWMRKFSNECQNLEKIER